jgi:hypothetical protein
VPYPTGSISFSPTGAIQRPLPRQRLTRFLHEVRSMTSARAKTANDNQRVSWPALAAHPCCTETGGRGRTVCNIGTTLQARGTASSLPPASARWREQRDAPRRVPGYAICKSGSTLGVVHARQPTGPLTPNSPSPRSREATASKPPSPDARKGRAATAPSKNPALPQSAEGEAPARHRKPGPVTLWTRAGRTSAN